MDQNVTIAILVFLSAMLTTAALPSASSVNETENSRAVSQSKDLHIPLHVPAGSTISSNMPDQGATRNKRAIIFRPLFVYRQQEIKKQKLKQMREQQQQQAVYSSTQRPHTRQPVRYYASRYPYQRW
uniref:Uncharacterized protein n=1 Tax=Anopheles atroparvus TaxID=41427 RepID=A0AAG5D7Z8_ANOAO